MSGHLIKSADSELWRFENVKLFWSLLIVLLRPPWDAHPPRDNQPVPDVHEHQVHTVVQPEDKLGRDILPDAHQGKDTYVGGTEPPRQQIKGVFPKCDQVPSVLSNPSHFSLFVKAAQESLHLFDEGG